MKIILIRHEHDADMIEMWVKLGNKPVLMNISHRDCFDSEIIDILDDENGNDQAFVELKLVKSIGWSFAA